VDGDSPTFLEWKINMRSVVYGVAVIAAIGIMLAIAKMPSQDSTNQNTQAELASSVEATPTNVMSEPGTLTLNVPDMHCPFACYPSIKKTLESSETVEAVELAEQKEEGVIDNPQVIVNFTEGFDVDAAIASLEAKGFKDSSVVQ
jgi:hypothetical protein